MLEIKSVISEIKNFFDGFINRLDPTKERSSELEVRSTEIIQTETKKKRK